MFVVTCWQVCISDVMVALVGKIHKDMQLVSSMQSGVHSFASWTWVCTYTHHHRLITLFVFLRLLSIVHLLILWWLVSEFNAVRRAFIRFLNLSAYVHAPSSVDHLFCISPFVANCALAHVVLSCSFPTQGFWLLPGLPAFICFFGWVS